MIDEVGLKELLKSLIEQSHAVCLTAVGAAKEAGLCLPHCSVEEINAVYHGFHRRLDEAMPDPCTGD